MSIKGAQESREMDEEEEVMKAELLNMESDEEEKDEVVGRALVAEAA